MQIYMIQVLIEIKDVFTIYHHELRLRTFKILNQITNVNY